MYSNGLLIIMDRLFIFILLLLTLFGYELFALMTFATVLYNHLVSIDFKVIIGFVTLLTYYMYGFIGIGYTLFITFFYVLSGCMFWYEMSFEDAQSEMNKLSTNFNVDPSTYVKGIKSIREIKDSNVEIIYSKFKNVTKLTDEKISKFKGIGKAGYLKCSKYYDLIYCTIYDVILKFKNATNDIIGFKQIYEYCDIIYETFNMIHMGIVSLRTLFKFGRNIQNMMNCFGDMGDMGNMGNMGNINPRPIVLTPTLTPTPTSVPSLIPIVDDNLDLTELISVVDDDINSGVGIEIKSNSVIDNDNDNDKSKTVVEPEITKVNPVPFNFPELEKDQMEMMEKRISQLSPDERKQIDDMANQMLSGLFGGTSNGGDIDFGKLFGNMTQTMVQNMEQAEQNDILDDSLNDISNNSTAKSKKLSRRRRR